MELYYLLLYCLCSIMILLILILSQQRQCALVLPVAVSSIVASQKQLNPIGSYNFIMIICPTCTLKHGMVVGSVEVSFEEWAYIHNSMEVGLCGTEILYVLTDALQLLLLLYGTTDCCCLLLLGLLLSFSKHRELQVYHSSQCEYRYAIYNTESSTDCVLRECPRYSRVVELYIPWTSLLPLAIDRPHEFARSNPWSTSNYIIKRTCNNIGFGPDSNNSTTA